MANVLYIMKGSLLCKEAEELLKWHKVKYVIVDILEEMPEEINFKSFPVYVSEDPRYLLDGIGAIRNHFAK